MVHIAEHGPSTVESGLGLGLGLAFSWVVIVHPCILFNGYFTPWD